MMNFNIDKSHNVLVPNVLEVNIF